MLIVTAQVCKMFPFNAWDTAKIVGFLILSPKRFALEPIKIRRNAEQYVDLGDVVWVSE